MSNQHNIKYGNFKFALLAIIILPFTLISCYTDYNAPDDHMITEDGVMHKEGYKNPETNCVSCHGNDLKGGDVAVSCFECHDKKW